MNYQKNLLLCSSIIFMVNCSTLVSQTNTLSDFEKESGWQLLFDGKTTEGWRGYRMDSIPSDWFVEDGMLTTMGTGNDKGGDIITTRKFRNFELQLEWKISSGGNSGIFYHASEAFPVIYATAPEYQLIDAEGFPEKLEDWQQTGADYAMYPAPNAKPQPAGEWNSSGIKFNKNKVEYWLNNIKIVSFERYTYEWYQRRDSGKWKDYPTYGTLNEGYIGLQDHGSRVWFRNIKIKEL